MSDLPTFDWFFYGKWRIIYHFAVYWSYGNLKFHAIRWRCCLMLTMAGGGMLPLRRLSGINQRQKLIKSPGGRCFFGRNQREAQTGEILIFLKLFCFWFQIPMSCNKSRWWFLISKIVYFSSLLFFWKWSNLTIICFEWVGSTTN